MTLVKYKALLSVFLIGLVALFSLTNYIAYYNILNYWIFIIIELGGLSIMIFMFFIILRLDSIIRESGYIHTNDVKRMAMKCETIQQTLNKTLDKNYLSTTNESPASNRERIRSKKMK